MMQCAQRPALGMVTALMLAAMEQRSFVVVTADLKTEGDAVRVVAQALNELLDPHATPAAYGVRPQAVPSPAPSVTPSPTPSHSTRKKA